LLPPARGAKIGRRAEHARRTLAQRRVSPLPSPFPLVGRDAELALVGAALDRAAAGEGGMLLLHGEGGIGKTRLVHGAADDAERRGWSVAFGRAYPVEAGVPYALFADAFLPLLRALEPGQLTLLTRGQDAELAALFPALEAGSAASDRLAPRAGRERPSPDGGSDLKARLLWAFAQLVRRLAAKRPLLVVLENLQWADASSLELLHFLARQIGGERVLVVGTYNAAERDLNPVLRSTEQSLVAIGAARSHEVGPLSHEATAELLHRAAGADRAATREFAALLFGWTRGNPFFVEETLKALVAAGRLVERDGRWEGWTLDRLDLPRSIREALLARCDRLGGDARLAANLAAVLGARVRHDVLGAVTGLADDALLAALDELRRQRVLVEAIADGEVRYDFEHPMVRETLYAELGLARARKLHAVVAEALERMYGSEAALHADELAFHFARADARAAGPKAVRYLRAAGREALAKYANREAASYLETALDLLDRGTSPAADGADVVAEELARARQRLGEYDAAMALWRRARDAAERAGDPARVARVERRMGLASYWSGHYADALAHYEAGLADGATAGDDALVAQLRLAKGNCLLALGQHAAAGREVHDALAIAERLGDQPLLARAHRALLLLHTWTGPAELAREHGARAIALAEASGQRLVGWSAHWALAMLEGLTSNAPAIARHIAESDRLADELRSPLLRVWTSEVAVEYRAGIGEWDDAIALGEGSIATARALSQRTLLPRLLVWTGLIHLARDEKERAHAYLDEAWQLAGAEGGGGRPLDVHTVVPAHTGMVAYHIARGEHRRAIEIGRAGLAIADRSGYVAWAIYRLLPLVIEAALWSEDFATARELEARLRRDSARLEHALGLAWADTCIALIAMLERRFDDARPLLESAVAALDGVPFVFDAARLRCRLAYVLANLGEREEAMRELRRAHDVFARIGARRELDKTRAQMRGLGARPPARAAAAAAGNGSAGAAAGVLTGRELDIARLVARRKSNKEIGAALGISSRTVSTHLSNIFGKLGVGSRGELADLARDSGWLADRAAQGAE
jgi:DNA-binding CsgD family transcriptional regulator